MANTTTRTVELSIKLNGVQSIQELEDITKEINNELKGVATNSKEFTQMGNLAKQANSKLKEVATSLEGVTSTEKSEAVNKMGMALVGAFQAAAGASLLFGEKTGKQLEGVIKQVGGLFAITDALKKITEAFSAKNISALKSVVKGWQESSIAAKLFGTTVKTALVSTGIGALVVLLGVIIANWDKIKAKGKAALDGIRDSTSGILAPLKAIIGFFDNLIEKVGSLQNLFKGIGGAITSLFRGENIAKGFNDAVTAAKELDAITLEYKNTITDTNDEFENQKNLLTEIGGKEQEILNLEKERNQNIVRLLTNKQKLGTLTDDEAKALKASVFQLELLNIKQTNLNNKRIADAKAASEKAAKEKADAEAKTASDKKDAAARKQELADLKEAILLAEIETEYQRKTLNILTKISELDAAIIKSSPRHLITLKTIEGLSANLLLMGKDYVKILSDALFENKAILKLADDRKIIEEDLALGLISQFQYSERIKANEAAKIKYTNALSANAKDYIKTLSAEEKIRIFINEKLLEKNKLDKENLNNLIAQKTDDIMKLGGGDENRLKNFQLLQEIATLRQQINELDIEGLNIQDKINVAIAESVVNATKLKETQDTHLQNYIKNLDKFFAKYGELINASRDLINGIFDLATANAEAEVALQQANYDAWLKLEEEKQAKTLSDIDAQKEAAVNAQKDANDEINDLNSELADANGDRYYDILALIEAQKQAASQAAIDEQTAIANKKTAEDAFLAAKLAAEEKVAIAERKAAKIRKQQAIVDAIINTALSVLSALKSGFPLGLIMAAVFAALGLVQIATIKKQPTYAEGIESTPKTEVALVGEEGPELVKLPRGTRVYKNADTMSMLNAVGGLGNVQKLAGGGTVTANPNNTSSAQYIDYKQIGMEVANALKANPMFVSVTEIRNVENRLKVIESRASI